MRVIHEATYRFIKFFMPLLYLRTLNQDTVIHQVNKTIKMKMRVGTFDKWAAYQVWKFGSYEGKGFTIQPRDTVIDIGGHIGSFSIWAARQATKGKVYAFEPNRENFSLLQENKKLNKITNLKVFNLAVSDTSGKVTFFNSVYQNMGHSLFEDHLPIKTVVKTISLTEVLESNHIEKVDYLKIDAEGAEYPILLNTSPRTFKKISKIIIEYHDYLNHGHTYQDIESHLKASGFQVEISANILKQKILKFGLLRAAKANH